MRQYPQSVLPLDAEAALHARALERGARLSGHAPSFAELTLACIAQARGVVVTTRNVRHFTPMGVTTLDPFGTRSPPTA